MTDIPQLSEVAAPPTSLIIKGESQISQSIVTNEQPLLNPTTENKNELNIHEPEPNKQLELTNKTFIIFFFPKIYQHGICALLLLLKHPLVLSFARTSTLTLILVSISLVIIIFPIIIIKGIYDEKPKISKVLLFFSHFLISFSIGGFALAGSLCIQTRYPLYFPFLHLSVICLIITICLLFTTKWFSIFLYVLLVFGILSSAIWIIFIEDAELIVTLVVIGVILLYYIIFSIRTTQIMNKDTDTAIMQYNTIFYSAIMSIYCLIGGILAFVCFFFVFICIGFCIGFIASCGGNVSCNGTNCGGTNCNCNCKNCDTYFLCSKNLTNRKKKIMQNVNNNQSITNKMQE